MATPEAPRWLDDEERQSWIALASVLMRLPVMLDARLQAEAGISFFEYQVLAGLSMAPERTLRMSSLAVFTEGSLPRLSQAVGRLEKRAWVRRTPDPDDGRSTLAVLSDLGWEKVVAAAPGHVETVRRFVLDPLTGAQVRQLGVIGDRIIGAIEAVQPLPGQPRASAARRR